jgi:hypothetical protein
MNTYICRYCRQPSDPNAPTCPLCGAPVDIRSSVSDSGWVEQPAIKDMARLQFGQSHVQIAGTTVPVAEFNLAPNDWIYFSHHTLLWTEPATRLINMPMRGGWNRMMAGMPLVMVEARGPGHVALSDNHAGEVIALPLQHGQQIWVREHRFLTATGNIKYDWYPSDIWYETGDQNDQNDREMHYPMGRFGDVFGSHEGPGLLLLHARSSRAPCCTGTCRSGRPCTWSTRGTWASPSGTPGGATAASGSGSSALAGSRCNPSMSHRKTPRSSSTTPTLRRTTGNSSSGVRRAASPSGCQGGPGVQRGDVRQRRRAVGVVERA